MSSTSRPPRRRGALAAIAALGLAGALAVPASASAAGGVVWTDATAAIARTGTWTSYAMDDTGNVVYAAAGRTVIRSVDGGTTWTQVYAAPNGTGISALSIATDDDGSTVVIGSASNVLIVSQDGGANWTTPSIPNGVASGGFGDVAVDGDGDTIAGVNTGDGSPGSRRLYLSTDGGGTLQDLGAATAGRAYSSVSMSDSGQTIGVASMDGGPSSFGRVQISTDRGQSWNEFNPTGTDGMTLSRDFRTVTVSGDGSTVAVVNRYTDFSTNTAASALYLSYNDGATWTPKNAPGGTAYATVSLNHNGSVVLLSGSNGSTRVDTLSLDGAMTWTPQPEITGFPRRTAMNAAGTRFVSTNYNQFMQSRILLGATAATAPVVTTQPVGASVTPGTTVTLTAAATGSPAPTVRWQTDAGSSGSTWTDVQGATATTLTLPNFSRSQSASYRAVFTNGAGSATTAAVFVSTAAQTVPSGGAPSVTPAGGASGGSANLALGFAAGARVGDGLTAALSGSGLQPNAAWTVDMFSTPTRIGSGTVSPSGALLGSVTIPSGTAAGSHRLLLSTTGSNGAPVTAQAWFAIDAAGRVAGVSTTGPVAVPAARTPRGLAQTGAELPVAGLAGLAGLLLAGAGVALVAARRRRTV